MKVEGGRKYTFSITPTTRTFPVFVGMPADELQYSRFTSRLVAIPKHPRDIYMVIEGTYVTEARNELHRAFVEEVPQEYEWFFMLDTDVLPPINAIDKLIARNKSFIGGWYRNKNSGGIDVYSQVRIKEDGRIDWAEWSQPGDHGYQKVDAMGLGCQLMHRSVAEMLGPRPYTQHISGEDLELCYKLRKEHKTDVYVDWELPCDHLGMAIYSARGGK